jgi:hypothetical protein
MDKFLKLHKRLLKKGLVDKNSPYGGGLCNVEFNGRKLESHELLYLIKVSWSECHATYWGYDGTPEDLGMSGPHPRRYEYTPLRQNIILLLAALNNEL